MSTAAALTVSATVNDHHVVARRVTGFLMAVLRVVTRRTRVARQAPPVPKPAKNPVAAAGAAAAPSPAIPPPAAPRHAPVERIASHPSRVCPTVTPWLKVDEAHHDIDDRPWRRIVERLCRNIGLKPDWSLRAGEGWRPQSPPVRRRRSRFVSSNAVRIIDDVPDPDASD